MLNRYDKWTSALPGVQPFYAVKCNPDKAIIKTLAALGAGFDCASMVHTQYFRIVYDMLKNRIAGNFGKH